MKINTLIIDTDAGADDLLAIYFLAHSNKYKTIKIIANYGIFSLTESLSRLTVLLEKIGKNKNIELFAGEEKPIKNSFSPFYQIHGEKWKDSRKVKQIKIGKIKFSEKFDYLSLAPLTNLSKLTKNKFFLAKLNKLYIMGGAISFPGNASPLAEANFFWDPVAVEKVFKQLANKITLLPLNITETIQLNKTDLKKTESYLKDLFEPYLKYYLKQKKWYKNPQNFQKINYLGASIHDLVTVVSLVENKLTKKTVVSLSTKLINEIPGFIFPVLRNEFPTKAKDSVFNIKVVTKIDSDLFWRIFDKIFKK